MSDRSFSKSGQGRWDHLLKEIPNQAPTIEKPTPPPAPEPPPVKEEEEEYIFSVSEINRAVKKQLEGQFARLWLKGEISNFKAHTSGHYYFSLKDDKAQISAVMFKGYNSKLKFRPESGMEVIIRGKITVYEPRGNYQVFCESMEPVGAGALQKAFEQLKAKLQKEGLFDQSIKKALPSHPQKIAVVTSPTGAAIQDILNVLKRRSRRAQVVVIPARVQGEGAAPEIVRGIKLANQVADFDVMIVGRGGGSIEDLWCFNEEIVARAIHESKIPVISAVGHEIDFTIADFVADLRAPTPSAAAEVVAKSEQELLEKLKFYSQSLKLLIQQKIKDLKKHNIMLSKQLLDPRKYVQDSMMKCDDWTQRLIQSMNRQIENKKMKNQLLKSRLVNPQQVIDKMKQKLISMNKMMVLKMTQGIENRQNLWTKWTHLLDSLSPLKVVDRGYAIVRSEDKVVQSVKSVKKGDALEIQLKDGSLKTDVKEVQ
ncbi:MAG: exodeoxyribonuclease VII large subunit [Bdellovibrionales bacterium]|nr:exodeoxyribonuclease VII large subunit [Bdellovibrionales bacterium]NQZ19352.1 exodeoxyribonuclease VII large subunit [Bdellovibrionales bacterium]